MIIYVLDVPSVISVAAMRDLTRFHKGYATTNEAATSKFATITTVVASTVFGNIKDPISYEARTSKI